MKSAESPSLLFDEFDSPVGKLRLVGTEKAIHALLWSKERDTPVHSSIPMSRAHSVPLFLRARAQLAEYFAGERRTFDLPLNPQGTEFQLRVWRVLRQIPYGETLSYGEQAKQIGAPKSARAVGGANGRNPLSILVPCHRVVGSNGDLTGFGGGIDRKRFLLDLEKAAKRVYRSGNETRR